MESLELLNIYLGAFSLYFGQKSRADMQEMACGKTELRSLYSLSAHWHQVMLTLWIKKACCQLLIFKNTQRKLSEHLNSKYLIK